MYLLLSGPNELHLLCPPVAACRPQGCESCWFFKLFFLVCPLAFAWSEPLQLLGSQCFSLLRQIDLVLSQLSYLFSEVLDFDFQFSVLKC